MKFLRNKSKVSTVALVVVLTIAATSITSVPMVNATIYDVYAFISLSPNPVGVGQTVLIVFFLDRPAPLARAGFDPLHNWGGYEVTITKPDGSSETDGPYVSDATGGRWTYYTPDTTGIYEFQFSFGGQWWNYTKAGVPVTEYYRPATSDKVELVVQQEEIAKYQTPSLPTGYWERPIYGENRGWYQISGNWLMAGYNNSANFNPYTTAPNTAHIVWTKPIGFGGVVGGEMGDLNYYQAPSYQSYWNPPLIIQGRLYYNQRLVPGNEWAGLACVDLRTGEQLWFKDYNLGGAQGGGSSPTLMGQLFDAETVNGHGVFAYLWNIADTYTMYDANTGNLILSAENAPALKCQPTRHVHAWGPPVMYDEMGSLLVYVIDGENNWLALWNSTKLIESAVGAINVFMPPVGATLDWKDGISWNVSIPDRPGIPDFNLGCPRSDRDVILAITANIYGGGGYDNFTLTAYSAKDGHELWWKNITAPLLAPGATAYECFGPIADGVLTFYQKERRQWYGFDVYTGEKLWGPTEPYENAWDIFGLGNAAYGKLYFPTFAGKLYCHNLTTGELLWTYSAPPSGFETPYGTWPLGLCPPLIADGKAYLTVGEHTPNSPYYLGTRMYVVDADTGKELWSLSGWWAVYYWDYTGAIADGYLAHQNCLDGKIYCFGKGKTATTVSVGPKTLAKGSSTTIEGTILDMSPGAEGTPCIADEYMTEWMEYLHMQKPCPTDVAGVEVILETLDPNGNFYEIDRVTSDAAGMFKTMWEPPVEGEYTIIARFAGSESYWSSYAETSIGVSEAPLIPSTPETEEAPAYTAVDLAIIAAVVVVALLVVYDIFSVRKLRK